MLSAPPPLYVRAAVPADLDRLAVLRAEAAAWIADRHGSQQWSDPFDAARSLVWIERGATVMALLEPDGEPVATVTDRPTGSRLLWTPQELAEPARYFSRFTVDREYAGQGIGTRLADWARWRAAGAGARLVRANAWSDNAGLHAYYRAYGWQWVRTVTGSHSGALFEMPVRHTPPRSVHELGEIPLLR
jgi:GNAT superfamily N-acetyltransferase